MSEVNNTFETDYSKKLYTLEVVVYKNSSTIQIQSHDGYNPTYHEVVGLCETTKHSFMETQREQNMKAYKKQKPKP